MCLLPATSLKLRLKNRGVPVSDDNIEKQDPLGFVKGDGDFCGHSMKNELFYSQQ